MMVLETKKEFSDDIKETEYYDIHFNKVNSFQNYIDSEVLTNNLNNYDAMVKHVRSDENPTGRLAPETALLVGLRLTDQQIADNDKFLRNDENKKNGEGNDSQ